jgi:hypothetical protein
MNPFDDEDKIYMTFELRGHGKEQLIRCEYDEAVHWSEVVDDVVKQIEASWGYSFDLPCELGVYYKGKDHG